MAPLASALSIGDLTSGTVLSGARSLDLATSTKLSVGWHRLRSAAPHGLLLQLPSQQPEAGPKLTGALSCCCDMRQEAPALLPQQACTKECQRTKIHAEHAELGCRRLCRMGLMLDTRSETFWWMPYSFGPPQCLLDGMCCSEFRRSSASIQMHVRPVLLFQKWPRRNAKTDKSALLCWPLLDHIM